MENKNRNLTLVTRPPSEPPLTIAYRAFDDFAESMEQIASWSEEIEQALHTLQCPTSSRDALDDALYDASIYSDPDGIGDIEVEKCRQFAALFDPPSNYENPKKLKPPIIAARLAKLINSFPNSADGQRITDDFVALLIDEVAREQPSFIVLESTCRHLVHTLKFVPSVTEVLEAISERKKLWRQRWRALNKLRERQKKMIDLAAAITAKNRSTA